MCSSPHWQVGLSWFREKLSPTNREQSRGCREIWEALLLWTSNMASALVRNQMCTCPMLIKLICATIICSSIGRVSSDSHLSDNTKIAFRTIGRPFRLPLQRQSRWANFAKNCLPRIGSKVLPRFREKYRALGRQKWGPTCDRDISNSTIYTTAIYREYTVLDNMAKDWTGLKLSYLYQIQVKIKTTKKHFVFP